MKKTLTLVLAAVALSLSGCGVASSSSTVGPGGGTVVLQSGLSLRVPAGALSKSEVITLRESKTGEVDEVEVGPSTASLSQASVLSWSDDGKTETVETEAGEGLEVHRQCGRAHVHLQHFGHLRCSRHRSDAGRSMERRDAGFRGDDDERDGGQRDAEHHEREDDDDLDSDGGCPGPLADGGLR